MQFTDNDIQDILRENRILKKDLEDAREELNATARLYDTMVVGTNNILILSDGGSRSAVYVSPNVEEALGLPRELVMSDIRELGPKSGDIPGDHLADTGFLQMDKSFHISAHTLELIPVYSFLPNPLRATIHSRRSVP